MNKIILADLQAIYRAGAARVLAADEDMRIVAQCGDLEHMYRAVAAFPGSVVVFAAGMHPDMTRLSTLFETTGSRGVVIAESNDSAWAYLEQGLWGVVFRNITGTTLLECVHRVAAGDTWLPSQLTRLDCAEVDLVGRRLLDCLSPKEVRVVALVVNGCKNREIALRLGTTEQVVKNNLRSIYDKAEVNDRLELALFAIRHPVLSRAIAEVGGELELEDGPPARSERPEASAGQIRGSVGIASYNRLSESRHIS